MVSRFRKSISPQVLAGGLVAGFLLAFGRFFAPPPPGVVLAAGSAAVDPAAGMMARLLLAVWRLGGEVGMGWLVWGVVFIGYSLLAWGFLLVAGWLAGRVGRRGWVVWCLCGLLLAGWAIPSAVFDSIHWTRDRQGPGWATDLVKEAAGAPAYLSPTAIILSALYGAGGGGDPVAAARLAADPSGWRNAAREAGWSAAVLAGTPGEYRELLDHLVTSPDWRLAAIRPGGFLFLRDGKLPAPLPDPEKIDEGTRLSTALALARFSEKFEAIGEVGAARKAIFRALELAPRDPEVLLHAAHFAAARKRWHDVADHARDALQANPRSAHAWYLLAMADLESADPDVAREAVDRSLQLTDSMATLALKARICRAQRDFIAEAETLRILVERTPEGTPSHAEGLVFLGQAWASAGQAPLALAAYRSALDSPGLPPDRKPDIEESIGTIKRASGLD